MLFPQILGVVATLCRLTQAAPLVPQPDELSEYKFRFFNSLAGSKLNAADQVSDQATQPQPQRQSQNTAKRDVTINMILQWFEDSGITVDDVLRDHGLLESRAPAV
ncbi:hypothetical protein F5X68DRAFT_238160 [Plectosphaerella plurivora]|uniref:Uncharacterized protein n=1 Tax=Plectosphaerella plurivora TaxID=936078 RepID=A0A9P8VNS0_9PEZI|nr:hypothetical protein F5X68DRAFT_238160 [Plectosphaerella plurivora]